MRIFLLTILLTCFVITPVFAKDVVVGVNGMVCDFCAQSLNKVFMKEPGVENLDISLGDKTVTIHLADGSDISDKKIRELINWAGYETASITRDYRP